MRTLPYVLVFVLAVLGVLALGLVIGADSAEAQEVWWDGEGADNLASTTENWNSTGGNDIAPNTGYHVVFNGTSTKSCTWDITAEIASFLMDTGYSGTVTQGNNDINIGAGGFGQVAGVFTGVGGSTHWVIDSGDFAHTGGTITNSVLRLWFTGTSDVNINTILKALKNEGNITLNSNVGIYGGSITNGEFYNYDTINIASAKILYFYEYGVTTTPAYENTGTINGPGNINFQLRGQTCSIDIGDHDCLITIQRSGAGAYHTTLKLLGDSSNNDSIFCFSSHATYTMTLDTNGYNLTCTGDVETGTRGIIDLGEGTHTFGGDFDGVATGSGAIPGTSTCYFTGTDKTIELQAADSFYNLYVTGSYTLNSIIEVSNHLYIDGELAHTSYCVEVTGNGYSFDLNGTFDHRIYLNGTGDLEGYVNSTMEGSIYCDENVTLHTSTGSLSIKETGWYNVTVIQWDEVYGWYADASTNLTFEIGGLAPDTAYDKTIDAVYDATLYANGEGVASFYHDSWSGHFFELEVNVTVNITSTPDTHAYIQIAYYYNVTCSVDGTTMTVTTNAEWLVVDAGEYQVKGIPLEDDAGFYYVNITLSLDAKSDYQNYTLEVNVATEEGVIDGVTILGIILCGMFTGFAFFDKRLIFLAGITWMLSAMIVFGEFGALFLILPLGFGMILVIDGVFEYVPD